MEKLSKDFFKGGVLICGCTKADNLYYKRLYKYFTANGVEVFGLPTSPESDLDFKTYPNFDALPQVPRTPPIRYLFYGGQKNSGIPQSIEDTAIQWFPLRR